MFAYVQLDGSWGLNNTGFLVGADGVAVIDTCFTERRSRAFLDAVARGHRPAGAHAGQHPPPRRPHARQLAAPRRRRSSATSCAARRCSPPGTSPTGLFPGVDWGEIEIAPPFVTFDDRLDRPRRRPRRSSCSSWARPTRPTTSSRGCPSAGCCSPATSCSTAARRSW